MYNDGDRRTCDVGHSKLSFCIQSLICNRITDSNSDEHRSQRDVALEALFWGFRDILEKFKVSCLPHLEECRVGELKDVLDEVRTRKLKVTYMFLKTTSIVVSSRKKPS